MLNCPSEPLHWHATVTDALSIRKRLTRVRNYKGPLQCGGLVVSQSAVTPHKLSAIHVWRTAALITTVDSSFREAPCPEVLTALAAVTNSVLHLEDPSAAHRSSKTAAGPMLHLPRAHSE
jgi:hypothetical protein